MFRTPLILTAGNRAVIEEQLADSSAGLRVEAEVHSVEAIRRLLLVRVGQTIMPVSAFHTEIRSGSLVAHPVAGANLHRILVLARPVAESHSAAIDEIEHTVRAEMAALLDAGLFRIPLPGPAAHGRRVPA